MDEREVRTDLVRSAKPWRVDDPSSWTVVRVTHVPSGLSVSRSLLPQHRARQVALAELDRLVAALGAA